MSERRFWSCSIVMLFFSSMQCDILSYSRSRSSCTCSSSTLSCSFTKASSSCTERMRRRTPCCDEQCWAWTPRCAESACAAGRVALGWRREPPGGPSGQADRTAHSLATFNLYIFFCPVALPLSPSRRFHHESGPSTWRCGARRGAPVPRWARLPALRLSPCPRTPSLCRLPLASRPPARSEAGGRSARRASTAPTASSTGRARSTRTTSRRCARFGRRTSCPST